MNNLLGFVFYCDFSGKRIRKKLINLQLANKQVKSPVKKDSFLVEIMKSYKNIKELNKEWKKFGFRINEKGELLGIVDGKEYKCGKATFYDENGKSVEQERESKKLKSKK